jgi:c-di-GMP-binding flagellar brake protein YcgR
MADLPEVNSLLYITVKDELNHRSRVEDRDGALLTVAAPIGAGDVEIPEDGSELTVFWTGTRARYVLPVRMMGRTRGHPARWHLLALTDPIRKTRRRFVRGGGGGPIELVPKTVEIRERRAADAVRGQVIDISEGGVRCRVAQADLVPGDPVVVRVQLGDCSLQILGRITSQRPEPDQPGVDVIVTYHPSEADAQVIRRYVFQWEIAERRRRLDAAENDG